MDPLSMTDAAPHRPLTSGHLVRVAAQIRASLVDLSGYLDSVRPEAGAVAASPGLRLQGDRRRLQEVRRQLVDDEAAARGPKTRQNIRLLREQAELLASMQDTLAQFAETAQLLQRGSLPASYASRTYQLVESAHLIFTMLGDDALADDPDDLAMLEALTQARPEVLGPLKADIGGHGASLPPATWQAFSALVDLFDRGIWLASRYLALQTQVAASIREVGVDDWRRNQLLHGVADDLLAALGPLLDVQRVAQGSVIYRPGDASTHIWLIGDGQARVSRQVDGECIELAVVEAGDYFGEMGILQKRDRSATVEALDDMLMWGISTQALRRFSDQTGYDLLTCTAGTQTNVLGERLTQSNLAMVESLKKGLEEFRLRAAFGAVVTNLILLLFLYTFALTFMRASISSGTASTVASSCALLVMAMVSWMTVHQTGFPASVFGFTLDRWRFVVADSLAWSVLVCLALTLAKALVIAWVPGYEARTVISFWVDPNGPGTTIGMYLAYAVMAPVQEFVVRGGLQGSLQRMLTGRHVYWRASLVANAVFAIIHQHLGMGYAGAAFLAGLFWGWLYHRHGSLLGVCLSHVLVGTWVTGALDLASLFSP